MGVAYRFVLSFSLQNPTARALQGVRVLLSALPERPYWIHSELTVIKSPSDMVTRTLSDKSAIQAALDQWPQEEGALR